jgi:hypothetical protein
MIKKYSNTLTTTVHNRLLPTNVHSRLLPTTMHTRNMGWRAGRFPKNSDLHDKKQHLSLVHDTADKLGCQHNTATHMPYTIPYPNGVLACDLVSNTDLKNNNANQYLVTKTRFLSPEEVKTIIIDPRYNDLLSSGRPMSERLNAIMGYPSDFYVDTPLDDGF